MYLTRRDFLRASSALAAALGLRTLFEPEAFGAEGGPSVVWLQGQGCTGCSVSLLNSIEYGTIDDLLVNTLDLNYHPNVMAAAGSRAVAAAEAARGTGGYVLVVEGSIPTAENGEYCYLWPGLTALDGVKEFGQAAGVVLAVGTCSAFGGMPAGAPNPTGVRPLRDLLHGQPVINIPGCPVHPDWIVGTVAHLLKYGTAPALDSRGRPRGFYGRKVHDICPLKGTYEVHHLGEGGCLKEIGCEGPRTFGDCPTRKWNTGAAGAVGVNWCAEARANCIGCTEPSFPDGMSPFFELEDNDDRPATLLALAVSGPNSLGENSTASFTATATFSGGSTRDVSLLAEWSEDSPYATVSGAGVLASAEVPSDQTVTIAAQYAHNGVSRQATKAVTIENVATDLTALAIGGPSSVPENAAASFTATATFSDGTTQDVTAAAAWSDDSPHATISDAGVLTAGEVAANETVTITASYTHNGVTKRATKPVVIENVSLTLVSLAISGPASVAEKSTAAFKATATLSNGTTPDVTDGAQWGEDSPYAEISQTGVLTTSEVPRNQTVTVTASYTFNGVVKSATKSVAILDAAPTLTALAVTGPGALDENSTATYRATATFSNGSTEDVTAEAQWSEGSPYAAFAGPGVLASSEVPRDQEVKIKASYAHHGVTKTATKEVKIRNVAAVLASLAISGPDSLNENSSASFKATATMSDGNAHDCTVEAHWSEDSPYATITAAGVLLSAEVPRDQAVRVRASYTLRGVTRAATKAVTIRDVSPRLVKLEVRGPETVNERSTAAYAARATLSNGATWDVTAEAQWSEDSPYATISAAGVLSAAEVPRDQELKVTARYTHSGLTKAATRSVKIKDVREDDDHEDDDAPSSTLSALTISGPSAVNEASTARFTAIATFSDGSTRDVTAEARWSEDSRYATIRKGGRFTSRSVRGNKRVKLTARYKLNGVSKTARKSVTIVDRSGRRR